MGHREKHRRVNWVPERLAAAEQRRVAEEKRQYDAAKAKEGERVD